MKILLNSIYPYAFAALFLIVPFDEYVRALPNILLIVLSLIFPFLVSKNDFQKLKNPVFIVFIVLIGYLLLNSFFLDRISENFGVIKKILLSAAIVLLALPLKNNRDKIYSMIILSSIVAILFSTYKIILLVNRTGTFEFGNSQNAIDTLLIDRLYLGFLCVLSVVISIRRISKKYNRYNKYYVANIIINVLFIFLIVSRIAIITLIVLVIIQQLYGENKFKRIFISLIALTVICSIAFMLNDNLKKRFFYETEIKTEKSLVQKTLDWEPRTVIWACASKIAKSEEVFLLGLGFESLREELVSCYDVYIENSSRREWFLFKKFNSHNQFIEFYLSTGFFSMILFVMIFIIAFLKNYKSFFLTSLLITILMFGIIESFFYRQIGAYYFGIILVLLLFEDNKIPNSSSKENFDNYE